MTEKEIKYNQFMIKRQQAIRAARKDFWTFNKLESPTFYKDSRWHLRLMSDVLQALYRRQLTKAWFIAACARICPPWFHHTVDYHEMVSRLRDDFIYERIIMNEPPRIGKSRTLTNFCKWCFGDNVENRIITCSFNDTLAQDFSRYTRDGIMTPKNYPHETIYNDIFPDTVVQQGNASYKKWALEGQFFSYLGAGIGGTITGKGGNILIVDDPVKDAEEALNELRLETIWTWYAGTFLSRLETEADTGKNAIQIVNMTRWAAGDVCGRILGDEQNPAPEAHKWFVFKLVAKYPNGEMLCPDLLNEEQYNSLKTNMLPVIFEANYHQKPIDMEGRLYKNLKTYVDVPTDENGRSLFERIVSYTDTADTGEDYLVSIVAGIYQGQAYVLDVLYSQASMEVTEPLTAALFCDNFVGYALIESNNGGRGFARAVERTGWDMHKNRHTTIKWFTQSKNKLARIHSNSASAQNNIYFPLNWRDRWPDFYTALTTYQAKGKNAHDDAPDAFTGLYEMLDKKAIFAGEINVKV